MAAAASERILMLDFHNRVNSAVAALQETIANDDLGRVIHGNLRLSNTTFVPREMLGWASLTVAEPKGCHDPGGPAKALARAWAVRA